MPKIVVFVGPSIPVEEAKRLLEADYRPPAKRGDLLHAAVNGADIIGLIDGVFFQDCSVAHKEILMALERGVKVIGASSMGALRASEMDVYDMEGVGEVYRLYKSKEIEADDEVALVFDPLTYMPRSEPLVNIRYNLNRAVEAGVIERETAMELLKIAKGIYFPERCYDRLFELAHGKVSNSSCDAFKDFLERSPFDLKKEDAIKALKRIAEISREMA